MTESHYKFDMEVPDWEQQGWYNLRIYHGQILGGLEILKEMLKWRLNFL